MTDDQIRAFIAIELPHEVRSAIRKIQDRLRVRKFSMSWVRPENIHLTLKFLGNIRLAEIQSVEEAMADSARGFPPLRLSAGGIGVFPGLRRPRVVWVGVSGQIDPLKAMQESLENRLDEAGFPREEKPFRGHLTLGRVKGRIDPDQLGAAIKEFQDFRSEPFNATELILFRSDLKPDGAVYTRLRTVKLGEIEKPKQEAL